MGVVYREWMGWCLYVCDIYLAWVGVGLVCGWVLYVEDVRCSALSLDLIPLRQGILMLEIPLMLGNQTQVLIDKHSKHSDPLGHLLTLMSSK